MEEEGEREEKRFPLFFSFFCVVTLGAFIFELGCQTTEHEEIDAFKWNYHLFFSFC